MTVLANRFEHKDIVEPCVETFDEEVCLPMAKVHYPVERAAETVGALGVESVGKANQYALTTNSRDVEVFVVSLGRTESG